MSMCARVLLVLVVLVVGGCERDRARAPEASLRLWPTTLVLRAVYVGGSITGIVEVRNESFAGAGLRGAHIEGCSDFSLGPIPSQSLPGTKMPIEVRFAPSLPGRCEAKLVVATDSAELVATLEGEGLAFPQCPDGGACMQVSFDPVRGACIRTPREGSCEDGNVCTEADRCVDGLCRGAPATCDDGHACTIDTCDLVLGCVHEADAALCDDGNPCTTDRCDGLLGCTSMAAPDGWSCGERTTCRAMICSSGACVADEAPDETPCGQASACAREVCRIGACATVHMPDGTACEDGSSCSLEDVCAGGRCVGTPLPDGTLCDDGAPCTVDERCAAGLCIGAPAPDSPRVVATAYGYGGAQGSFTVMPDGRLAFVDNGAGANVLTIVESREGSLHVLGQLELELETWRFHEAAWPRVAAAADGSVYIWGPENTGSRHYVTRVLRVRHLEDQTWRVQSITAPLRSVAGLGPVAYGCADGAALVVLDFETGRVWAPDPALSCTSVKLANGSLWTWHEGRLARLSLADPLHPRPLGVPEVAGLEVGSFAVAATGELAFRAQDGRLCVKHPSHPLACVSDVESDVHASMGYASGVLVLAHDEEVQLWTTRTTGAGLSLELQRRQHVALCGAPYAKSFHQGALIAGNHILVTVWERSPGDTRKYAGFHLHPTAVYRVTSANEPLRFETGPGHGATNTLALEPGGALLAGAQTVQRVSLGAVGAPDYVAGAVLRDPMGNVLTFAPTILLDRAGAGGLLAPAGWVGGPLVDASSPSAPRIVDWLPWQSRYFAADADHVFMIGTETETPELLVRPIEALSTVSATLPLPMLSYNRWGWGLTLYPFSQTLQVVEAYGPQVLIDVSAPAAPRVRLEGEVAGDRRVTLRDGATFERLGPSGWEPYVRVPLPPTRYGAYYYRLLAFDGTIAVLAKREGSCNPSCPEWPEDDDGQRLILVDSRGQQPQLVIPEISRSPRDAAFSGDRLIVAGESSLHVLDLGCMSPPGATPAAPSDRAGPARGGRGVRAQSPR